MWWPRKTLAPLLVLALAACGFRPMYGVHSVDPQVAEQLASIAVPPLADRTGQLLHTALLEQLNPHGEPAKARYVLSVSVTYTDSQEALLRDNTASRNLVNYVAYYTLSDQGTRVAAGSVHKQLSYDFLPQHYADISAQEDVQKRAAQVTAEEIRNDLSAYFIRAAEAAQGRFDQTP